MAKKQVYIVYQDCPMCGSRYNWGLEQTKIAQVEGIEMIKCPFYSPVAKENKFCSRAVEKGIGSMPFFTDGEIFSTDLNDFVEKPVEKVKIKAKPAKSTKKTTKKTKKQGKR